MEKFITQLRVRHYEMDALGHVNNAVYQHYLEQAGLEHSEYLGFTVEGYCKLGGMFVMRRLEIDYLRPAVAGNTLEITTWVKTSKGPRSIRCYEIRVLGQEELVVKAEATWVWVNLENMRPKPIPALILESFQTNKPISVNEALITKVEE